MKMLKFGLNREWIEVNKDTVMFVGRCGSGLSVFGERAYLDRTTKSFAIFKTESGTEVKTPIDELRTVGKACKNDYFITDRDMTNEKGVIISRVHY